ncbi:MAG: phospho-N-acetylmuramoyl-pentapeptide-transferase [Peptococcaceae bacterium]|nr:phospho-N-acetylmuramoyl-pentapeptide-transferase [Peptococcaceae bacterium]
MENYWSIILKSISLSFFATVIISPLIIPALRRLKFGQNVRDDGPVSHLSKAGTPTMGGIVFLAAIALVYIAIIPKSPEGALILVTMLGFGLIGLIDDFMKIVLKRPLGLRAREKLAGQVIIALILAFVAVSALGRGTDLVFPFIGRTIDIGQPLYYIFCIFVLLGVSNGVNLTDGVDGLASGVTIVTSLAFMIIALFLDEIGTSVIMASLAGTCLGFFIFNRNPAKVFMGDTGSLALGGALGAAAVVTKSELFLAIIGIIYVLETLSVILQVYSFKVFGRRIFRMSPLHHHFELGGWSENRIVAVFVLITIVFSILGILGYIIR